MANPIYVPVGVGETQEMLQLVHLTCQGRDISNFHVIHVDQTGIHVDLSTLLNAMPLPRAKPEDFGVPPEMFEGVDQSLLLIGVPDFTIPIKDGMVSEATTAVASLKSELLSSDGVCSWFPGGWDQAVARQLYDCVDTSQQTSKEIVDRLVRVLGMLARSRQ